MPKDFHCRWTRRGDRLDQVDGQVHLNEVSFVAKHGLNLPFKIKEHPTVWDLHQRRVYTLVSRGHWRTQLFRGSVSLFSHLGLRASDRKLWSKNILSFPLLSFFDHVMDTFLKERVRGDLKRSDCPKSRPNLLPGPLPSEVLEKLSRKKSVSTYGEPMGGRGGIWKSGTTGMSYENQLTQPAIGGSGPWVFLALESALFFLMKGSSMATEEGPVDSKSSDKSSWEKLRASRKVWADFMKGQTWACVCKRTSWSLGFFILKGLRGWASRKQETETFIFMVTVCLVMVTFAGIVSLSWFLFNSFTK